MSERGNRPSDGGQSLFVLPELSIAAHELKSPLALIRQLGLELETVEDQAIRETLTEQIILTAERSLRMTTNLTKASRKQANLFVTEPTNPHAVLSQVQSELAPLYNASSRQLTHKKTLRLPLVATNSDLLRRIICNFGDNALHYADEAGVVELYTQLRRNDGTVRIGVRDYGPALPIKVWRSLHDTHYAHQSSRPDSSGIGLHIAHHFAEQINATIGAIRHRDGTSFYVDVPVSKQLLLL